MFKDNTLFVVGAGASAEFDLPVGSGLADTIAQRSKIVLDNRGELVNARNNGYIFHILKERYLPDPHGAVDEINKRILALNAISDRLLMAESIDSFIDMHHDDPMIAEMGKMQIAVSIGAAERAGLMQKSFKDGKLDLAAFSDTWIHVFTAILFSKTRREDVERLAANVTIICFNYDRCIEFYLAHAINQTFEGVGLQHAQEIVAGMNIIHPYGSLGRLTGNGDEFVPLGPVISEGYRPWATIPRLKTFTEQVEDDAMMARIHGALENAKQTVFLGFGFQPQNMDLLRRANIAQEGVNGRRAYATGKGVHMTEVAEVKSQIQSLFSGGPINDSEWSASIHVEVDVKCNNFMWMHRRNMEAR